VKRSAAVALLVAALFFLWHAPLLTEHSRIRGFNSDAAIIGLMGKKMLEGRGFDIFFWGQNYVGSLTSMLTAAWGFVLGAADPLALRLAAFSEAVVGLLLVGWALARVDGRAAVAAMVMLAITPPVLLRMMITPLGAEMGYFMATALFAFVMQHLTAPPGRGWLSSRWGQFAFGVLTGLSWWMNQQVVFTLLAAAAVLTFRSQLARSTLQSLRTRQQRPVHGLVEAFLWLTSWAGVALLAAFVLLDVAGRPGLPFVFGRFIDGVLLIAVPQLLHLALAPWSLREFTAEEKRELGAIVRGAAGFLVGYLPVWLGRYLGWYELSYVFGFNVNQPAEVVSQVGGLYAAAAHWAGFTTGALGIAFAVVLSICLAFGLLQTRSRARAFIALIPLANVAFFLLTGGVKHHYFITSVGMLFGLAGLGAVALWDAHGAAARTFVAASALLAVLSIGVTAKAMHRDVRDEPDPMPLLARVRANQCAVCYSDFWITYRYAFLDGEQRAWIPYHSQNRTRTASRAMQKLPGQRCLITNNGQVQKIDADLPLTFVPPRKRR
jgi:hypothetical protein